MPTVNIPPLARFVLYLVAAIALLTVTYAVDKHWVGDAEVRYVTGLAALANVVALAKVNLSETKQVDVVAGQVTVEPAPEAPPADQQPDDEAADEEGLADTH